MVQKLRRNVIQHIMHGAASMWYFFIGKVHCAQKLEHGSIRVERLSWTAKKHPPMELVIDPTKPKAADKPPFGDALPPIVVPFSEREEPPKTLRERIREEARKKALRDSLQMLKNLNLGEQGTLDVLQEIGDVMQRDKK